MHIAEQAREAFFRALAEQSPAINTGDLPPEEDAAFREACERVALAWVESNRPQPELSHDQLQGLSRFADDLSKGAHEEPVRSVAVCWQRDGLADVHVNGERQDFRMDPFGNPVHADPWS